MSIINFLHLGRGGTVEYAVESARERSDGEDHEVNIGHSQGLEDQMDGDI